MCSRGTIANPSSGQHTDVFDSIKPFWPLLFTFILPRALGYYRALKVAYRTRPPPRPLPAKASRSLNVLFVSICIYLWLSLSPTDPWAKQRNVFADTKSRLNIPSELLFSRIALNRPHGVLTRQDEELRANLNSIPYVQTPIAPFQNCRAIDHQSLTPCVLSHLVSARSTSATARGPS